MRYKRQSRLSDYRLSVPQLSGGLNTYTDPTLIDNDELSAVQNLEWKNGALTTRKALQAVGEAPFVSIPVAADLAEHAVAFDSILSHPFEVDGQLCTVVISAAGYGAVSNTEQYVQVVSLDGAVLKTYTIHTWVVADMAVAPCDKAKYGCAFLLFRGNRVYKPNDDTGTMELIDDDEIYAPLLMINGKSIGVSASDLNPGKMVSGVMYEGFNMLTARYRARFTTGEGVYEERFYLPTALRSDSTVTLECETPYGSIRAAVVCGDETEFTAKGENGDVSYTFGADATDGRVYVRPALPKSVISDNLTLTVYAEKPTDDTTSGATMAVWFGGSQNRLGGTRLFLSGFSEEKAKVMWSDVSNPLYFPENSYMFVGDLSQRVTALEKQEDMLVIFKERELYYTTYVQGSIDEEAVYEGTNVDVTVSQAYFPLTQLSPYIGCDCPHTIAMCRNRLVWLCTDGRVYTLVAGGQYSERNVREIGTKIRSRILRHDKAQLAAASAIDHDGCYRLVIGSAGYSFHYGDSGFVYLSSYASSDSAMKNISWYEHAFDGVEDGAAWRFISDGAYRAIAVATQSLDGKYTHARTLYVFGRDGDDRHIRLSVTENGIAASVVSYPIISRLTTKAYDFGDSSAYKRIKSLFLTASAPSAFVRFTVDGQEDNERKRFESQTMQTHLVMPCVKRCQTLAVTVESDRPVCIKGLRLHYSPFGTVR